ncbi:MAG: aldo/keto reductase [Bacteroidetes bacterium]|nr:aldo/keto reductase [Bacteroidota bacterium]
MKYRKLGKSGLLISEIGFGCMSLAENDPDNTALIHRAIDLGINFFDTADFYQKGLNEIMVGKAIREKRKDLIIASKVGNQWKADGSGWDWNPNKDYILSCIDKTLQRLQTDYIDLYQLHGGTIDDPIDETIDAFEILQRQGKIRYYGISSIRPNVIREYVRRSNIVSVMMQFSLLDRRPEETCLDLLLDNNIGVLARGSLAKGLLVDKPAAPYLNYNEAEIKKAASAISNISGTNRSKSQSAIHYVLRHPAISSAVVGIRTIGQLDDVALTSDAIALNHEEVFTLNQILNQNYYDQHR